MSNGFDRLRVSAVFGAAGSLALGFVARSAPGASAPVPLTLQHSHTPGASKTEYKFKIGNSSSGPFGAAQAFGVKDASVMFSGTTFFPSPHHTVRTTVDAFDGAADLKIGSALFANPDGTVDRSLDSAGNDTVTSDTVKMSGLKVHVQHAQLKNPAILRSLYTFVNPSRTTKRVVVQVGTDFGDDAGPTILSSSDGDSTVQNHDSWFNTSQPTRPFVLIARGDRHGDSTALASSPNAANDDLTDQYALTVKPHHTVRLLYFIQTGKNSGFFALPPSGSNYQTGANLAPGGLLDGLSDAQLAQIANWRIPT